MKDEALDGHLEESVSSGAIVAPPNNGVIELAGAWALPIPYTVIDREFELAIEHLADGITVTAPVGWRVHVPTHSGVRYVHIPEGWSSVVPLATQCVVIENGESFINLTYREPEFAPADLEIGSDRGRVKLTWQFHHGLVPPFRCLSFSSWRDLIDEHRAWLQNQAGVKPVSEVAPAWLAECPLQVYVDIERIAGDGLHHSFEDVVSLAQRLHELDAPPNTMIYLTTWNNGFERSWPTYEASEQAGGLDGLRAAADALHERGYRLMLHANVWGCAPTHPEYTQLVSQQVHNRAGHPLGWRQYHRSYVSEFIYIRPDSRNFREVFWGSLEPIVKAVDLDLLYLDHAGLLVDDPLVDVLDATRVLTSQIQAAVPGLALGGQALSSRLCDQISLWQLWGTPWSGHGWGQPFRRRSPIVADLFRDLTRFAAHIHLPAAVPGRFLWTHERFADDLGLVGCFLAAQEDNTYHGAMPCVRLNYHDFGVDPLSFDVIDQARRRATARGFDAPPPVVKPRPQAEPVAEQPAAEPKVEPVAEADVAVAEPMTEPLAALPDQVLQPAAEAAEPAVDDRPEPGNEAVPPEPENEAVEPAADDRPEPGNEAS